MSVSERCPGQKEKHTPVPQTVNTSLSVIDGNIPDSEPFGRTVNALKQNRWKYLLLVSAPNTEFSCISAERRQIQWLPRCIETHPHWKWDPPWHRHCRIFNHIFRYAHLKTYLPFSIHMPWWAVLDASDIWKTIFIKDVAWAICQWMPVPCGFSGGTLYCNCRYDASQRQA